MKYKKIKIETNGTAAGTHVSIDGKQISAVQRLEFSTDIKEVFAHVSIQVGRLKKGELMKRKTKVRDPKTEKFVDKEEIMTETLILERDV